MHVGDLPPGFLGHAIEHGQAMGSQMTFNFNIKLRREGQVVCESNMA